jgi:hypothetical protein
LALRRRPPKGAEFPAVLFAVYPSICFILTKREILQAEQVRHGSMVNFWALEIERVLK